jgi:hypothetical protein
MSDTPVPRTPKTADTLRPSTDVHIQSIKTHTMQPSAIAYLFAF